MGLKDFFRRSSRASTQPEEERISCTGKSNVLPPPPNLPTAWQPLATSFEVIVTGDLGRTREVAEAVMRMQEHVQKEAGGREVQMRVSSCLDGCLHQTPWSTDPTDIGSRSTRWHCHQGASRFGDALQNTLDDRSIPATTILIIGDRFDENLSEVKAVASQLHQEKGTKIIAIPVNGNVDYEYKEIAEAGGGGAVPLSSSELGRNLNPILEEITRALFKPKAEVAALPPPSRAAGQVRALLEQHRKPLQP